MSASSVGHSTSGPHLPQASTGQRSRSTQKTTTSSLEVRIMAVKSAQPRPKFQQNLSSFFQIPFSLSYPLAPRPFWYPPKPQIPTSSVLPLTAGLLVQSPEHLPPCIDWDIHWTVILSLTIRSQPEVAEGGILLLRQTIKPAQFFLYKVTSMEKQNGNNCLQIKAWKVEKVGRKIRGSLTAKGKAWARREQKCQLVQEKEMEREELQQFRDLHTHPCIWSSPFSLYHTCLLLFQLLLLLANQTHFLRAQKMINAINMAYDTHCSVV